MSVPAAPVPLGQPSHADHQRACDRLSAIHGRPVTGGWQAEQLAADYAACYAEGFRAAMAEAVPEPRDAWRDTVVRGGIRR